MCTHRYNVFDEIAPTYYYIFGVSQNEKLHSMQKQCRLCNFHLANQNILKICA